MNKTRQHLILADDDVDDCLFFKDVLEELPIITTLKIVHDGPELMSYLLDQEDLPDTLFLDLNMPLKDGLECLSEIKTNHKLQKLPVIIFSTSLNMEIVNLLYEKGAHYYIRKPGEFSNLKKVILKALTLTFQNSSQQPDRAGFVLLS